VKEIDMWRERKELEKRSGHEKGKGVRIYKNGARNRNDNRNE
jgi:hypothetical protein